MHRWSQLKAAYTTATKRQEQEQTRVPCGSQGPYSPAPTCSPPVLTGTNRAENTATPPRNHVDPGAVTQTSFRRQDPCPHKKQRREIGRKAAVARGGEAAVARPTQTHSTESLAVSADARREAADASGPRGYLSKRICGPSLMPKATQPAATGEAPRLAP